MDKNKKKEIIEEWKNRRPKMGVISFCCKLTGESFLGISKDTNADYNSNHFKLFSGTHPNKRMQELWQQYGEEGFEFVVLKVLKYEDPLEDHTEELEELRALCFADNPQAKRIWK